MEPAGEELVAEAGRRGVPDPVAVLREARSRRLALAREDLRLLLALVGTPEVFATPTFITDFVCAYLHVRRTRPRFVVDLWAAAGWMLPPLVATLRPARAIGILPDGRSGELAELLAPPGGIVWRIDDARAAAATLEPGVDVVLGCPPWRWQPRPFHIETADSPLVLTEDPANVALLEACTRLAPDGTGLFIVGPGFVMRPGPGTAFANLKRFGLSLHLLLELPRGIFSPDSGSGRLLIGIGPAPCPAPLIDSLTPDPHRTSRVLRTAAGARAEAEGWEPR
ncbi:hypothetical protein [Pseudonocardia sp. H11422]|uniref:hypothetical protein n=1 Tax=Pseudonocardia sp. H11422 TaxID=2835866 RepID=UPI001BDC85DE|nr:hypothetical protein [Pseudonocardia sp. H11422]